MGNFEIWLFTTSDTVKWNRDPEKFTFLNGTVMMDSPVDTKDEKADKSFAEVGPHVGIKTNSWRTRAATDALWIAL